MLTIFSKGKVFPKCRMAFADLRTHLMHQIRPCYEYAKYSLRSSLFTALFLHYHNIFRIQEWEEEIFRKCQIY